MNTSNTKTSDDGKSGEDVNGFRSCRDLSDIVPLYTAKGLYLKPIAKINISVNLPQLKTPGKTLSTWEVLEKLRLLIRPDEFSSLKVSKSTLEFMRLEADLTDKCRMSRVLARLEGQRLNLAGFASILKVRAAEAKDDFPTKHTWNSFFRDAKHMNELKPGERPDTVYISGLPVKWFSEDNGKTPSESMILKMFRKYGNIRRIDVPAADSYRSRMRLNNTINKKCNFADEIFFDAYIQYFEYVDFVKLMDAVKGMKLMKKDGDKYLTASIKVDFDKTKHMSDNNVSHREFERKRLIAQDNLASEKFRKKAEAEAKAKEELKQKDDAKREEKYARRKNREENRKRKALAMFRKQEEDKVSMKIAREEQKLIKAQRQLESIRLLDELFDRIKIKVERGEIVLREKSASDKKDDQKNKNTEGSSKNDNSDKLSDKKEKKLKKKKLKREKKKKKKERKNFDDTSDDSSSSDELNKKKLKSALGTSNPSFSGSSGIDLNVGFSPLYTQFPQPWFYDAAAVMFPPIGRGRGAMNRFLRGRGRGGFSGRRGRGARGMNPFNPHIYNDQYYKYFASLTGVDCYGSDYSTSRSRSRDRSRSRNKRKLKKRRTSSRSYSSSRSRSQSRSRSRQRSRSKSRTRSRSRTKTRSRSRAQTRTRSRSRVRTRSQSRSRRSRSKSDSKLKRNRRNRSRSKVKITRAKSRSTTPKRRSRSKSWSLPKSPRQRSCSWSKVADELEQSLKQQQSVTGVDESINK